MNTFLSYIVEQEIINYAIDFDAFILNEAAPTGDAKTSPFVIVTPEGQKVPKYSALRQELDSIMSEIESEDPKTKQKSQIAAKKTRHKEIFTQEASNPKLTKSGEKVPEYMTIGLSLAPSTMSGIDVCPCATDECKKACLGKEAGRAVMTPVRGGRIEKTNFLFDDPKTFMRRLTTEIDSAKRKAEKEGKKLAVRMNVLSDIPWEHIAPKLFKMYPDVQFYDYTKIPGRTTKTEKPQNYHLTFSSTGVNHPGSNWAEARKHLDKGGVVSMVFNVKSIPEFPEWVQDVKTGKKYKVVDGDSHDHRHLDKVLNEIPGDEGVISGLKLKGTHKGKAAAGNFAVEVPEDKIVKVEN